MEKIVDISVRKTRELNADSFIPENLNRSTGINAIVCNVKTTMEIEGVGVETQLYRILPYEEGVMFKAQQEYVLLYLRTYMHTL